MGEGRDGVIAGGSDEEMWSIANEEHTFQKEITWETKEKFIQTFPNGCKEIKYYNTNLNWKKKRS